MTTVNLGRVGFVLKGSWVAGTYKKLDVVRHGTKLFGCITQTTTEPPSADWLILVEDGATGANGANGINGLNGTGSSTQANLVRFNVIGTLGNPSAARWYPNVFVAVSRIFVVANNPVEASGNIVVKRGDEIVCTLAIARLANRSNIADGLSIGLTDVEYLAIEGDAALGRNNFTVYVEYSPLYVSMPNTARLNILKAQGVIAGTAKLYLNRIASISKLILTSTNAISLSVKKNGTQVAVISLANNQFNTAQAINITLGIDDYITADVLTTASDNNATLTLEYTT